MSPVYMCLSVLFAPGVLCQVTLLESGPGTVKPSETLKLTCKVTGVSITSSCCCWDWIRQPPGKGLEWLGRICSDGSTAYSQSLKSRLSISRDTALNEYSLQMTNMRAEDTSTVYCARRAVGPNYFDVWGPGTLVTVTSGPLTAPHVFPLVNCCPGAGSTENVTIGCLVSGYRPQPVSVDWKAGSSVIPSQSSLGVLQSSGLYISSSSIKISRQNWESESFSCTVNHSATNSVTKGVSVGSVCSVRESKIAVKLVQASCPESDGRQNVSLVCYVSSAPTSPVEIKWREDSSEVSLPSTTSPATRASDGTYSLSFTVHVSQSKWNQGTTYSCYTTDPKTKKEVSSVLTRCSGAFNCLGIVVSLYRPTAEDLFINKKGVISCQASNLPASTGAVFTWIRERGNCKAEPVTENPELTSNGLFSISSRLPACAEDWNSGERFTCRVEYPGLTEPIVKTISKDLEVIVKPPSVYINGPTTEELSRNEMVTITCVARGFAPADISIKWLQAGQEIFSGAYDTTKPQLMKETGDYICVSIVQVDAQSWNSGSVLTCVVIHEGAPHNVIQQSTDKSSGKPTVVNVSLSILDSTSSSKCY